MAVWGAAINEELERNLADLQQQYSGKKEKNFNNTQESNKNNRVARHLFFMGHAKGQKKTYSAFRGKQ